MENKNTGGPAFPQQLWGWSEDEKKMVCEGILPGATLRDYFAGQALIGIRMLGMGREIEGKLVMYSAEESARQSYLDADAMIKERTK